MALLDDEEYAIPLRDQRFFGAGIRKRKVKFVPSSTPLQSTSLPPKSEGSAADRYLAIVLGKKSKGGSDETELPPNEASQSPIFGADEPASTTKKPDEAQFNNDPRLICDICARPVDTAEAITPHESSIAHQLCLQHSYPPSHLDRSRKGLAVLQDHGWDPDSRRGLGAEGEGIMYPIRAVENPQKAGLGAKLPLVEAREKRENLDAGKVREREQAAKREAQRLRSAFYVSEDVLKYLGEEGGLAGFEEERVGGKGRRRRRK